MNELKPKWNCPVCDRPAVFDTLVIDGYFKEVLASNILPADNNEIQLHNDGSWSSCEKAEDTRNDHKKTTVKTKNMDIDDDIGETI